MLAQLSVGEIVIVVVYLLVVGYLGWLGFRRTRSATDYMIAGRKINPFVMAMSYGATFISTSAIVGFGGAAGVFGMSLLWLAFLNIFVGIFLAFVFLGGPTRRLGHRLDAHTFPELLGRRFNSRFIQVFAGLVIFLFIPLYAAAVLIGGCEFIHVKFDIPYEAALLVFSVIIAAYVVLGGLKGVMYTDALQGSIMLVGMLFLLVFTYVKVGGIVEGHQKLTGLADLVPAGLQSIGHRGWTSTPEFGWGKPTYNVWWIVFSTIVMGVGIGVLAQPQLLVRFMTVRSGRELNRAVLVGGIFILMMTGVAFTVGSLTNAYFAEHGKVFEGRVAGVIDQEAGHVNLQLMKKNDAGQWVDVLKGGKPVKIPAVLAADEAAEAELATVEGKPVQIVKARSIALINAGSTDKIIPTYITKALPGWFGLVFLLTLLAAAMSTLSSQFHTLGTSMGRDVYEQISGSRGHSVTITRIAVLIGIVMAVLISGYAREEGTRGAYIIARATAIFFGLCASAFLPALLGALFWKRMTKIGAAASMVVGFVVTAFWLVLVKAAEADAIGIVQKLTDGKKSILAGHDNWPQLDPLFVAFPISLIVAVVVSLATKKPTKEQLAKCFPEAGGTTAD